KTFLHSCGSRSGLYVPPSLGGRERAAQNLYGRLSPRSPQREARRAKAAILDRMSLSTAAGLDVRDVQTALKADGVDGWLLYDFRGLNPIAVDVTAVDRQGGHLSTRRWFYLIPASGEPRGLVHKIQGQSLAPLPGALTQ